MALNPLSDFMSGVKSIAFKMFGKKSDNSWEAIKTNDSGALKVDGQMSIDQTTDGTTNKVSATQATHDNFNANANLQVGDADVSTSNPVPTTLTGSKVAEVKDQTNAVNGVLTFSENISAIGIYNTDTVNDGVFTVNGIAIPVPAGLRFDRDLIGGVAGTTVTVTGATSYIVIRYE